MYKGAERGQEKKTGTTQFRHFTLQDFNGEEIDTFTHKWYRSRLTNENEARQKAEDLQEALRKKPRIMELARNPLRLTIIGIIHRYEAQLPEDRRRFLEKVAFHLQMEEKGEEAGTIINRSELYEILIPDFKEIFCCDNRRARSLVEEFLETIHTRSGLLVELASDQFGFVHKTFQEYFAARFIANEVWINLDLQTLIDYVDKYISNSFWQETLLLALKALPNKQTRKVLDHILKKDDEGEINQYLHHHHYFVMKFLAEHGRWLNDRSFVETQIKSFFYFSWNNGKNRGGVFYEQAWNRYLNWVSTVTDSLSFSLVSLFLLSVAEGEKHQGYLRLNCALALENLGVKNKAVGILTKLYFNQPDKYEGVAQEIYSSLWDLTEV